MIKSMFQKSPTKQIKNRKHPEYFELTLLSLLSYMKLMCTSMADGELAALRREKETFRGMEMLNVLNLSSSVKGTLR